MKGQPFSRQSRSAGFTLVEILVAMTLMSVVMLGLGAAMRTIAQTEERVDQRLARADETRVASSFLSSTLGRISARKSAVQTEVGSTPFLFAGASDAVMWVGVMPARYGAGGRYFFRLGTETRRADTALVLWFSPWTPSAVFPDWSASDSRVLASNATSLSLEYGDDELADGAAWLPRWPHAARLPARVRVSLRTPGGDWPHLTIPLRQLPAGDNARGGFAMVGSE